MRRITSLLVLALMLIIPVQAKKTKKIEQTDRQYWCSLAYKMAQPVLENMSKGELQKNMKTEFSPSFDNRDRSVV
jgi:CRISPR/Cas system-associated protein endoribonuclease Cas2